MKIFITGVAGFLGSHLAERMLELGHDVGGCDDLSGGYYDNIPDGTEFYQQDCGDLNAMTELLKEVDVVYHCACAAYDGLSVFSPAHICRNTFQNTACVASAAVAQGVKRFVYCSSMSRYGRQESTPFTEDMTAKPVTPYGISKVAAENLLQCLSGVHGMEVVIAVPHNIIGPRQKYDDPFRNVASIMINRMLQGKRPIIYGDGEQKRCFSFVQDCVSCLEKMAFQDNAAGQVINIGPDEEFVTINELGRTIADLIGINFDPLYVKERPLEVKLATCSANKARELLGYQTTCSLRQGLQTMIGHIMEKGTKEFDYDLHLEISNGRTPKTWVNKMF